MKFRRSLRFTIRICKTSNLPFKITNKDNIVFSSSVIPSPGNLEQFAKMERQLKKSKPKIFRDLHVSGHGREEDIKEAIRLVKPKHIIPWHGDLAKTKPMVERMKEFGYKLNKTIHLPQDGEVLEL